MMATPAPRGGRSSVIYGTPPIGTRQNQGQSMASATKKSPAIRVKMSARLKDQGHVGGGVISAEPKVSGAQNNTAANVASARAQANQQKSAVAAAIGTRAPGDPLDNPALKAVTKPPGATVTTPRRTATFDSRYGYNARYDSNSPQFKGSATAKPGKRVK